MPTEVRRMNYSRCNKTAERVFTSDENSVLNYPHKFTPLQLSRLACGWFNPSACPENG